MSNGNFATGNFAGWNSPVDPSIVIDSSFPAPGDRYDASFTGSGILSQSIATVAGQAYTLSFSLLDEAGFSLDSFLVRFGTFSATIRGSSASVYSAEFFSVPGTAITGTTAVLSFRGSSPSGQNWNLDDVSLLAAAVPKPPTVLVMAVGMVGVLSWRRARSG